MKEFHHAYGVYGIYAEGQSLLVIKKNGGPYKNRYDLPGGSLEEGEGLVSAVKREFLEETGFSICKFHQLATFTFTYPWIYQKWNWNQHLCIFYEIQEISRNRQAVTDFLGQDSLGAVFIPFTKLTLENSSPLVLKARDYFLNPPAFEKTDNYFETWEVLTTPIFKGEKNAY